MNDKAKKDKKEKKLNSAQKAARIADLILIGCTRQEIYDVCKSENFHKSKNKIDVIIEQARHDILTAADSDPVYSQGESLLRLKDLYKKAWAIQDFRTCLSVQKELNRITQVGYLSFGLPGMTDDALPGSDAAEFFRIVEQKFGHLAPTPETTTLDLIQIAARRISKSPNF